jgi:diguanylate cyclase
MDRLGVAPLIRNYHLFYTCIANSDQQLRRAVRNLGRNPTQNEIDQVIEEFCPDAADSPSMRRHHNAVLRTLEDISARLRSEQTEMKSFNGAMARVTQALAHSVEEDNVSVEVLKRVAATVVEVGMHRVSSGNRALTRVSEGGTEISALRDELVKAKAMANTDPLTNLANRRSFDERVTAAFDAGADFALILLDIDHFKRVNDTFGHVTGDFVLKMVADTMRQSLRAGTFVARTGGEEFAVVLERASEKDAKIVGERVRIAIEKAAVIRDGERLAVTVSLGVALAKDVDGARALHEAADAALYRSKNAGRNRMTFHAVNSDETDSDRYQIYKR